ncbi:MAG: hypothetical protein WD601_01105 [Pseudohongiellaceae bacterium]
MPKTGLYVFANPKASPETAYSQSQQNVISLASAWRSRCRIPASEMFRRPMVGTASQVTGQTLKQGQLSGKNRTGWRQ